MKDEIAISVKGVSKDFKLPHEKADSVKSVFVDPFNKNRKKFEKQHALRDISFDIKKGEFFGIVGRNGSGKSTLLKIIAGIYQPNEGKVTVNGRLVPFIELGVGFNPELTGHENMYLNGALMGFSEKEVDMKYAEIVEFAELERFMDQKLKNYSSGMQVRLAFSVATILAESDILLIDEVLAVGDADFQRKCFDYFKKLKKGKKTVIFVSHDMDAIEKFCDNAILIENSQLIAAGTASDIAKRYNDLFFVNGLRGSNSRMGGGELRYRDTSVIVSADKITINAKVMSHTRLESPVYGIRINSGEHKVSGTNTLLSGYETSVINRNDTIELQWSFQNIFSSGQYTVDLTAHSKDLSRVYDWWEYALDFTVEKSNKNPHYNIDVPFNFKKI